MGPQIQPFLLDRATGGSGGGHFAAFEQPELFADELRAFFRLVRLAA